jgi:hypothetical protein
LAYDFEIVRYGNLVGGGHAFKIYKNLVMLSAPIVVFLGVKI